jgi:hypothetical protein
MSVVEGEAEILVNKPTQCHFARNKSHMDCPRIEPGPQQ